MATPPAGSRGSKAVVCFAVVLALVDLPVLLLFVLLPVCFAEPVVVPLPVDAADELPESELVLLGEGDGV